MSPETSHQRATPAADERLLTALLVSSAVGVYFLIVVGATTSLLQGAGTCPTWPACDGAWLPRTTDPATLAAWGHRVAALLVALLLLGTAWTARRRAGARRVRLGLGVALALYPLQVAIGALTVVGTASSALAGAHLVVALAIFSAVVLALLWHLEGAGVPITAGASDELESPGTGTVVDDGPMAARRPDEESGTDDTDRCADPPALGARLRGYVSLTKPKLWWLLSLVSLASMGLAAGPALEIRTIVATTIGGILAIGASGTFNHVLERDLDRKMARTDDRPLVDGLIPVRRALAFGVALAVSSVVVFVAFVNVLAAVLGLVAILFYSVGYTLVLKPNTSQNVVIGGAVGAFPAFIGWAAVENTVGVPAFVLGAVIFLWTPAHFYNLALAYRDDYARAGLPMLPVVRGAAVTRRHLTLYLGATMVGAVLLGTTTTLGWVYALTATVFGAVFLVAVVGLHREQTDHAAMRAFHASNAYLGTLLLVVIVDAFAV